MPTRSYTLSVGSSREATVEGAGSALAGAPAVQVLIDGNANTKECDVLATLDKIKNQIISGRFPPA
jgi:hypothetical protein